MVDMVVHRHDLRPTLARLCSLLMRLPVRGVTPMSEGPAEDEPLHHDASLLAPSDEETGRL